MVFCYHTYLVRAALLFLGLGVSTSFCPAISGAQICAINMTNRPKSRTVMMSPPKIEDSKFYSDYATSLVRTHHVDYSAKS